MLELGQSVRIPQTRDLTIELYQDLDALYALYSRHPSGPPRTEWHALRNRFPRGAGRGAHEPNVRGGLKTLGLLGTTGPTELWQRAKREGLQGKGRDRIARHVLLERGGWAFCYTIYVLDGATREEIWHYYREHFDPDIPDHLLNIGQFNNFLAWAGLSTKKQFSLNRGRFSALVGLGVGRLGEIGALPLESRALLLALLSRKPGWCSVGELRKSAELQSGIHINPHVADQYLRPLKQLKLLEYAHSGHERKRRGQHGEVRLRRTKKAKLLRNHAIGREVVGAALEGDVGSILSMSYTQLERGLRSDSADVKGRSLERLAVAVCWRLGLRSIRIRDTGSVRGIELDTTAERRSPDFARFSVQCKNTASPLGAPILMKELGAAQVLGVDTIVLFSRAGFLPAARFAARDYVSRFGRNVVLLDGKQMAEMFRSSHALERVWRHEMARNATHRRGATEEWLPLFLVEWAHGFAGDKRVNLELFGWDAVFPLLQADGVAVAPETHGVFKRAWTKAQDIMARRDV